MFSIVIMNQQATQRYVHLAFWVRSRSQWHVRSKNNEMSSILHNLFSHSSEAFFTDIELQYNQWRTQKISEGGQVSSQSCDVTNQLSGECRRHDHSRGSGGMPLGKFCKITPKNTHFCVFWKQVLI